MSNRLKVGERRLGAIMFTDIVGYSAITSADEGRALRLLEEHRVVLEDIFKEFGGVVVKTLGDGFLVEFASAVEAVNCAVKAQQQLSRSNSEKPEKERTTIRIGIHVGDIVHQGGDVLGDAVNIAARLQPIAEPGGICITRQVVDQIERKVDYPIVRLGTRELKNIGHPIELYRVEIESGVPLSSISSLDPRRIAILPLANLSADPADKYFADGMTEELISTISRITELSVISRTSVMKYKDTATSIGEIGRELMAGTVLEGSVRKAGNKVRITTQLIDAQNDRHLWAQSYDRNLDDIFAIQADIAERVAEALRVTLISRQKQAVERKPTENSEAYTLYLKGRYYWNERTDDGVNKAIRYFTEAIEKDQGFALAYSGLADCYLIKMDRAWISYQEGGPKARQFAEKAVALDPESAEAHASLGLAVETTWDLWGAEKEFKKAIELNPSYATARHWYSLLLDHLDRIEESSAQEMKASELDPQSSVIAQGLGRTLGRLGKTKEALAQLEKVTRADPEFGSARYWKAWILDELGDHDRAIEEMKKAVELSKDQSFFVEEGLACLYLRAGRKDEADKLLRILTQAEGAQPFTQHGPKAMIKFDLGDVDAGFEELRSALKEHEGFLFYFREFSNYSKYCKDPRWKEIEREMGGFWDSSRSVN